MKASFLKLLKLFCAFAFLCLSGVTATAQIKVVGDDYRTNTKDISIMSIPFNPDETLPEYSGKTQYFGDYSWRPVNILGERFYLPESSVMLYLYTDTLANEYRIDTLPANKYYTVTALDVKYFKDSGPDSYSDLYGKYNNGYYTTFVDFVELVEAIQLKDGINRENIYAGYYLMSIRATDENGNNYIIPPTRMFGKSNLIPVSFYENVVRSLKNKKIALLGEPRLTDTTGAASIVIRDCISNDEIMIYNSGEYAYDNECYFFFNYTCTDVIVYKNSVMAIIEDQRSKGTFAVGVTKLDETRLPLRIGRNVDNTDFPLVYGSNINIMVKDDYDSVVTEQKRLYSLSEQQRWQEYEKLEMENELRQQQRQQELTEKYGSERAKEIISGKVSVGMTKEMCNDAWGYPWNGKETLETILGTTEKWYYPYATLSFVGNKLISIHKSY